MFMLGGGEVITYRIALGPDGVPNLERRSSAMLTGSWENSFQVVARGIEDLQVEYQTAGDPATPTNNNPTWLDNAPLIVAADNNYNTLVMAVRVTLSGRTGTGTGLSGVSYAGTNTNSGQFIRSSLTSIGAVRTALGHASRRYVDSSTTRAAEVELTGEGGVATMCDRPPRRDGGFALVLAMMALMLLTVLGLTLAATTTTEIQIAANYKWSQQAQINADAGIEVAKRVLRDMEWGAVLPEARTGSWVKGGTIPERKDAPFSGAYRDYENWECDLRGKVGYGVVLNNGTHRYENVSVIPNTAVFPATAGGASTRLFGAFTLWVRRPLVMNQDGTLSDYQLDTDNMVLTSEGTAPYTPSSGAAGIVASNRAVRVIEVKLSRVPLEPCGNRGGQEGLSQAGAGFASCLTFDGASGLAGLGLSGGSVTRAGIEGTRMRSVQPSHRGRSPWQGEEAMSSRSWTRLLGLAVALVLVSLVVGDRTRRPERDERGHRPAEHPRPAGQGQRHHHAGQLQPHAVPAR